MLVHAIEDPKLQQQIANLSSAESFLEFFKVSYQPNLLQVKRVVYLRLLGQVLSEQQCSNFNEFKAAVAKAYCLLEKGVVLAHAAPACKTCSGC
ncbi:nitrogenase-stabilizing/protective protein NifW [Agarivorans sp. Toyoura001]|uniref:nitrogenase-stabilizing/protective protein NifW n=1 Tax=unclassified Agarivorans TaxID=2636026 RepID=UPI0010F388D4|nr:nitrogenase-stabilizing/protective protein NifW [Agarivorans sp. Toyoura001]GDY26093.1 hypothetical protein AHAT_19830 [Agarivorans sp. Toyoura001]